ncbi:TIGR03826 family flagellar region protein [Bacillus thermotolerans]|uniref:TIGR03826 family flagellar region protein n=1 Tax=Bacillus thermotolerans TaxID=1221996 RepID=UPI00057E704E|nr:TIGR03826 family flagellar region protein [Bacillus thermotolerans]KKB35973.1 flagellar protein [Bacillus thermotolerans]
MSEIANCPNCGALFMKNAFLDVCPACSKAEEEAYQRVYQFLRKRENRAATIPQLEKALGVERSLIYKWVKKGRLHTAHFPNLGYPCDRCGALIMQGSVCESCRNEVKADLEQIKREEAFKEEKNKRATYYLTEE